MAERLGSLSYLGLVKETTAGVPLTPTDYVPLYEENMATDINVQGSNVAVGQRYKNYASYLGSRSHMGDFTVMGEPNTAARLFDMLLTKGNSTGSGPYTYPFTLGLSNSYTVDISAGNDIVFRYFGMQLEQIDPVFSNDEVQLKCKGTALGSFSVREISSVSAGSPNTITLKTNYDASPTTGLVANDLIRFRKADGTLIDTTVTAVSNGTQFTCSGTLTGLAGGDTVYLRPATPSYTNLGRFLWPTTQFCFGATASAALSAAQTRVERGSTWSIINGFEDSKGAQTSGSFDPSAIRRKEGEVTGKIKLFFDTADQVNTFLSNANQALVIRHFSAGNSNYELRITIDQFTYKAGGKPKVKSGDILYHEFDIFPVYNTSNSEAFKVQVINNLSSI